MKIIRTDYLNPAFQELVAQLNDRPSQKRWQRPPFSSV
jgi:hypothetical protein